MIPAKTEINDIEYIVLPEEIPRNLNTNLRRMFRINKVMENNAKKTPFLYNELQFLFIIYKLFGRFPVRVSNKGNVIISFLSRTSLYAAIVQSVLCISAIWLICETISLYGDELNILRLFALTESVLVSTTAVLHSISMWRDAKHLIKYINGWTEFEVLFKKCTRQELHLGLKRRSKISGIISVLSAILSPIFLLPYGDFWKHIFILVPTLIFTGGSVGCFMLLWCNNCTALAKAGQRLADNFEEYSRNGITPYRLYEYRMAWRKLSSLCDELGDVFSLTLWIHNIHAFLGFTLAGYSTVFFLRHLKLKPLATTLYTNLLYGVIMFIQFDFPGRVPNSVCELHFSEDQILRHSDCYDSKTGKKYCIPLQKPRLKQGAVPTIMPNCPSYLSSASSCRESGDQRRERLENRDLETALAESLKTHAQYQEERNFTDFQGFLQCLPKIQLLDDWITVKSESNVSFVLLNTCNIPTLLASIVVKSDLTMSLHVGKMELTNLDNRKFPIALSNINDVTDSIFKLDKLGQLENQDFKDHFQFIKDCLMKLSELLEGEKSSLINFICEQLLLINVPKNHYSYSSDFLIFCSILFSISPHAYKFMRSSCYLILPHPNTLHKICSAYNTNPAMEQIDKNFLLYIRQKFKFLSVSDSIVSLMVDEIHLKPYLDYTGGNILGAAYNSSNAAASAQVFMIQSLLSSFKDVVHILPVKNLNGEGLFQFIKKVVCGLHTIGFKVICTVTDNNALNRRAMSFFASPPKLSIVYKHPCDENQPLFYVLDSVHILKCIRNNWLNQKDVDQSIMYPSFETFPQDTELAVAKFSAIKTLHDIESTQIVKYANRLNLKSLFPTNLERQNVKLVLNVFNEMTIQGLEALGESNSIANFQATATFIKLICTWWSIVNVGSPGRDVRFKDIYQKPLSNSSDENFMYLERFLCWLDFWKNLPNRASALSKETHLAISHTTHALLEITKYCTQELNFKYLLPGKIQTDALEARFGKYRTMAGSQYLISLRQVFEIESKIRIQTLLSLKIPSNAFGEIDLDLDLFECDLKLDDFEASPPDVDLYCVDISEDQLLSIQEYLPVITYLSGYCVRAILRRLKCEICKTSLVLDRTLSLTDDEGNYELIRNVDRGGLHCPNPEVVNAIIFTYLTVKTLISEKYENMFMKHPSQRNLVVALAMSVIRKEDVFFVELPCTHVDHTHEKILSYIVKTGCNIFLNNYVKKLNNVQSRTNTKKRKLNSLIG